MEVTKKRAAERLGVSPKEVLRMLSRGELKGRKKTSSRFSDYVIELPDEEQRVGTGEWLKLELEKAEEKKAEVVEKPKPKEQPKQEPVEKPKPVEQLKQEESKTDKKTKEEQDRGKDRWWF